MAFALINVQPFSMYELNRIAAGPSQLPFYLRDAEGIGQHVPLNRGYREFPYWRRGSKAPSAEMRVKRDQRPPGRDARRRRSLPEAVAVSTTSGMAACPSPLT